MPLQTGRSQQQQPSTKAHAKAHAELSSGSDADDDEDMPLPGEVDEDDDSEAGEPDMQGTSDAGSSEEEDTEGETNEVGELRQDGRQADGRQGAALAAAMPDEEEPEEVNGELLLTSSITTLAPACGLCTADTPFLTTMCGLGNSMTGLHCMPQTKKRPQRTKRRVLRETMPTSRRMPSASSGAAAMRKPGPAAAWKPARSRQRSSHKCPTARALLRAALTTCTCRGRCSELALRLAMARPRPSRCLSGVVTLSRSHVHSEPCMVSKPTIQVARTLFCLWLMQNLAETMQKQW